MRAFFFQTVFVLAMEAVTIGAAGAEEFKYYVWVDEKGIVHAEEKAPKGRDYQVRIIENVNANVVPAEDFRLYGDLPVDHSGESGDAVKQPPSAAGTRDKQAEETAAQNRPATRK